MKEFLEFMQVRFQELEMIQKVKGNVNKPKQVKTNHGQVKAEGQPPGATRTATEPCLICGKNHTKATCPELVPLSLNDRFTRVKAKPICRKCFERNHFPRKCEIKVTCDKCQGAHNTLLHV